MTKRTFCDANDEIRQRLSIIKDLIAFGQCYETISHIEEVEEEINKIAEIVEETQDYVDSMENRLKEYKNSIINLGFKRSKDNE